MNIKAITAAAIIALPGAMLAQNDKPASVPPTPSNPGRLLKVVDKIAPAEGARKVEDKDLQAYLMVYHMDETHSVYFAVSKDGYTFAALNDGQPVALGKDLANDQKGLRNPHIYRGPDGAFYLTIEDMHVFGQREGFRSTKWERADEYGWGNNRAIVFMKSYDLIHWTHSHVRVDKLFPEFGDFCVVWAAQTIYDPDAKKLMVYFSTTFKGMKKWLVYAYADDAFTTLVTIPKRLFTYPKPNVSNIDADITKIGDTYHLFYKCDDPPMNLRHATSKKVNGEYVYEPGKVEPESAGTEGPNLWRRNGTDTYVLMYDVYTLKPSNMGFAETTDFKTYKNIGRLNEGVMKGTNFSRPKHGAVISITMDELNRLQEYFSAK